MSDMNEVKTESVNLWRKCSTCKKAIDFGSTYYVCSVSTCNGQRTGYVFCKVGCWESHVPGARHRDAAAIEKRAPTREAAAREAEMLAEKETVPTRKFPSAVVNPSNAVNSKEVLVIASRLKEYIDAKSGGYNTSQSVMDVLSDHLRRVCDRGIENAKADGRKTVMDRDFEFLKSR